MPAEPEPLAAFDFDPENRELVYEFLKRTRFELRSLRKVRVWKDRLQICDINGDYFEVRGLGYPDAPITGVLDNINTAYNREQIHTPTEDDFKEFLTGRRYPWAADRVM